MKIYRDIEQQTEEWEALRLGKITGTTLKAIMSDRSRQGAIYELAGERLSSAVDAEDDRARGNRLEPLAREWYERTTGRKVERIGFTESDECRWIGGSPDGLIEEDGKYSREVEIKSPGPKNYIRAVEEHKVPDEYWWQVVQRFVVNRDLQTLDFILCNPLISKKPYHVISVHRHEIEDDIESATLEQQMALKEVEAIISKYV